MASDLNRRERSIIERANINPEHVGPVCGVGAQSRVRELYDPNVGRRQVVKLPLRAVSFGVRCQLKGIFAGQTADAARRDYDISRRYLKEYVHPTDIRETGRPKEFAMIQDMIDFEPLTPALLIRQKEVRRQMDEILDRNHDMMREQNLWIDLMGWDEMEIARFLAGGAYMNNAVLDKNTKQVRIIDSALYSFGPFHRMLHLAQSVNAERYRLDFGRQRALVRGI